MYRYVLRYTSGCACTEEVMSKPSVFPQMKLRFEVANSNNKPGSYDMLGSAHFNLSTVRSFIAMNSTCTVLSCWKNSCLLCDKLIVM